MPVRLSASEQKSCDHSSRSKDKSNPVTLTDEASENDGSAVTGASGISSLSLSPAHRAQVKKVFAADLQSGILRMKCVVSLMKTDPLLRSLVNSKPHVKSVVNRVRYLFDSQVTADPYELPEESSAERTAAFVGSIPEKPPSSIESGWVEWSSDETHAIREAIMFCKQCPGNDANRDIFSKTQVLRDILKANTFERVRNKVKNEFRKMADQVHQQSSISH